MLMSNLCLLPSMLVRVMVTIFWQISHCNMRYLLTVFHVIIPMPPLCTTVIFLWQQKLSLVVTGPCIPYLVSLIVARNFPFHVTLTADTFVEGQALFDEFTDCKSIRNDIKDLYDHIHSSGDCSIMSGYMIHSHWLLPGDSMHNFWQLQASIIVELRKLRSLSVVVVFVHLDHNGRILTVFQKSMRNNSWIIFAQNVALPDCRD